MRIDSHIHTGLDEAYVPGMAKSGDLLGALKLAGMDGAVILSPDPNRCTHMTPEERMKDTLEFCKGTDTLFPFYWIDPLEEGAAEQVDLAVKAGFDGFKIICSHFYPGCQQSMDLLEKISAAGKPVLFHSGILWDGNNSANYNRPGNFEALIEIPKLRFALAHMSWPWCDECFAVYGKFQNAYQRRPEVSCEMFVDVTPGTPRAYREEVFRHMFGTEYEFRYNVMFGTDSFTGGYNVSWSREWQKRDDAIYEQFVQEDMEDFLEHVYYKNVMRFLGKSDEIPVRKIPKCGE